MRGGEVTLADRLKELAVKHGSLRAVARVTEIDVGYLSRLARGEKIRPSKPILQKLGLRAIFTYERLP